MGGAGIEVKYQDDEAQKLLGGIIKRMTNKRDAMSIIGSIARSSVIRNFEKEGRPAGWKGLSATTKKRRGSAHPILRRQGFAGGLMGSVNYQAFDDKVVVGTNKVYAAVHQFGAKKGSFGSFVVRVGAHTRTITQAFGRMIEPRTIKVRAHTKNQKLPWGDIPARPFLVVQDEDWKEMREALKDFVITGKA